MYFNVDDYCNLEPPAAAAINYPATRRALIALRSEHKVTDKDVTKASGGGWDWAHLRKIEEGRVPLTRDLIVKYLGLIERVITSRVIDGFNVPGGS